MSFSDPEDEVELVPAVKTQVEDDYEDYIPIFVIRRNEGSPFFGSSGFNFPFFTDEANDESTDDFPSFGFFDRQDDDEMESIPEIPLMPSSFFDNNQGNEANCGFICSLMKTFDDKLKAIEDQIKNIHNIHQDNIDPQKGNTTYYEKVCLQNEF